jgi:hypothetical protein
MRYLLSLMILIGLISCKKPVRQNNEITKVELARSGAWSNQGSVISIDSSLKYRYYGLLNGNGLRQKRKYYEGKISEGFWDTLNNKFKQINYKTIDTDERGPIIEDAHLFELIIHWRTNVTRIVRVDTDGNYPVIKTLLWLNNSYKKVKLKQVDSSFQFETIAQDPPHPNPIQIRFPPPIKKHKLLN